MVAFEPRMDAEILIRPLQPEDVEPITAAFRAVRWHKPREQYERYLVEQAAGQRTVLVAFAGAEFRGYVTVAWQPDYVPFREAGVPEIQDLNVLPRFRRQGIASRLMDEAERRVSGRSGTVGIGVGLFRDYGPAQRLYALRGYVPDGHGAAYHNQILRGGEPVRADDDLVLHLTRALPRGAGRAGPPA
jgi:GNAT superfamily N-acetyltransferase